MIRVQLCLMGVFNRIEDEKEKFRKRSCRDRGKHGKNNYE